MTLDCVLLFAYFVAVLLGDVDNTFPVDWGTLFFNRFLFVASFVICVDVKFGVGLLERLCGGANDFLWRFGLAERLESNWVRAEADGDLDLERMPVGGDKYPFFSGESVTLFMWDGALCR